MSHELFDRDSNIAHIREECGRITLNEGDEVMAGLMSAEEIFEKTQAAAVAATSPDEKALQIDYRGPERPDPHGFRRSQGGALPYQ